ncbi:hypothetical protein HanRHA438_Chr04g0156311 [Helianthus annuus]|uniref:Uncharacterized protein n=1 Tax=Helianthus annuus TaxID=4232 RepID=A0A1Y3BXR2_HELAN|nr:hypothetical protein HanXRQr2_Chr04g0145891 [Helianthus annuus]KAJ0579657.1 hypothetical protein HanHA300_Chr04g0120331 [Helianthus annuus]KAJ0586929.1 hypothetical protein HanIR_Chr04g0157351 [Helianthus annuus]KAJ0595554.1 hypothetical protein HanHA89_Chr04g0132611 [Helianthus annuus]KAJ0756209.1 hypothetical protein HanLR1_Chr04g0124431 [Helianthus annuus]
MLSTQSFPLTLQLHTTRQSFSPTTHHRRTLIISVPAPVSQFLQEVSHLVRVCFIYSNHFYVLK